MESKLDYKFIRLQKKGLVFVFCMMYLKVHLLAHMRAKSFKIKDLTWNPIIYF